MIVILSNGYPARNGEPFLATEINTMANQVDQKIVLVPLCKIDNSEMYKLPENVSCYITRNHVKNLDNLFLPIYLLWNVLSIDFLRELKSLYKQKKLSSKTFLCALYYLARSRQYANRISKVIKKQTKNENIILYAYWMHVHACACALLKRKHPEYKFFSRCHGYDLYEYRSSFHYLPYRGLIFEAADKIFPISNDGKKYLINEYSYLNKEKVSCAYLGTIDNGLGIHNGGEFHIISCSNVIPVKRIELIVKALSLSETTRIVWTHIGTGPLFDSINKLASEELHQNVKYELLGNMPNDSLMSWMKNTSIDLFLNVSESEGLPVSIMEAMSFGIPVIATNVGGTGEIVINEVNGFLLNKDISPIELHNKIEEFMLLSNSKKEEMRNNARTTWADKFNAKINYKTFYSAILSE